jgi:hypothetical protein
MVLGHPYANGTTGFGVDSVVFVYQSVYTRGRGIDALLSRRTRVRSVDGVDRIRARRTPPPAAQVPVPAEEPTISRNTHWGRLTPADADALRGLPAIGRGIGGGAIKGSQPGARF